jgi:hypothetical protein
MRLRMSAFGAKRTFTNRCTMSVRKRKWTTRNGEAREAFVLD